MLLKYIYNIFNLCYNFYGDIMKKILVTILILLFFSLSVYAEGVTLPILLSMEHIKSKTASLMQLV